MMQVALRWNGQLTAERVLQQDSHRNAGTFKALGVVDFSHGAANLPHGFGFTARDGWLQKLPSFDHPSIREWLAANGAEGVELYIGGKPHAVWLAEVQAKVNALQEDVEMGISIDKIQSALQAIVEYIN